MSYTVREWIQAFDDGKFDKPVVERRWMENSNSFQKQCFEIACDAGWYDWFCKDSALLGRCKKYAPLIKALAKTKPEIMDRYQVGFSQRLPMTNGFCDCIHIHDENDAGWGIYVDCPNRDHKFEVFRYGTAKGNDFETDTKKDLLTWFAQEEA